jgi:hypothetical protein
LLSVDSNSNHAPPGDTKGGGGATILSRQLLGARGPTNHPDQDDLVTYRVHVRFERPVDSPQIFFQVVTEVGTLAYGMQTPIGQGWQRFEAGQIAQTEIDFRPRLGGGTYRLMIVVTDRDGRDVLCTDPTGLLMYLAPRLGTSGFAELDATIAVNGQPLAEHEELLLAARGTRGKNGKKPGR